MKTHGLKRHQEIGNPSLPWITSNSQSKKLKNTLRNFISVSADFSCSPLFTLYTSFTMSKFPFEKIQQSPFSLYSVNWTDGACFAFSFQKHFSSFHSPFFSLIFHTKAAILKPFSWMLQDWGSKPLQLPPHFLPPHHPLGPSMTLASPCQITCPLCP